MTVEELEDRNGARSRVYLNSEFPLSLLAFPVQHLDRGHSTVGQCAPVNDPEAPVADHILSSEPLRGQLELPVGENLAASVLGLEGKPHGPAVEAPLDIFHGSGGTSEKWEEGARETWERRTLTGAVSHAQAGVLPFVDVVAAADGAAAGGAGGAVCLPRGPQPAEQQQEDESEADKSSHRYEWYEDRHENGTPGGEDPMPVVMPRRVDVGGDRRRLPRRSRARLGARHCASTRESAYRSSVGGSCSR